MLIATLGREGDGKYEVSDSEVPKNSPVQPGRDVKGRTNQVRVALKLARTAERAGYPNLADGYVDFASRFAKGPVDELDCLARFGHGFSTRDKG